MVAFIILLVGLSCAVALPTFMQEKRLDNPGEFGKYFEGDILEVPTNEFTKSGIIGEEYRWTNGIVPYEVDSRFDNVDNLLILTGLAHLEKYTCLQFVERTTEPDFVFVNYGAAGSGYFSSVGRRGGRQILNLEPELVEVDRFGTVVHEFVHAIGYYHEQSRTDRDEYVTINWSNINPGSEHNFDKYSASEVDPHGVEYDYDSLMHYGSRGFAIDPDVDTIIVPEGITIGQRVKLSPYDIQKINNMYCPDQLTK